MTHQFPSMTHVLSPEVIREEAEAAGLSAEDCDAIIAMSDPDIDHAIHNAEPEFDLNNPTVAEVFATETTRGAREVIDYLLDRA